jgi:hypothetical protein
MVMPTPACYLVIIGLGEIGVAIGFVDVHPQANTRHVKLHRLFV